MEATGDRSQRQEKPLWRAADLLTAARLPLAVAFVLIERPVPRLAVLLVAAVSDVVDGVLARRYGGSRIGAVLDPVCDKLFMLAAFGVVLFSGALRFWEVLLVLLRDIVAAASLVAVTVLGKPTALPARAGGKAVTVLQVAALAAFVLQWAAVRPLAWIIGGVSLYAIYDYARVGVRSLTRQNK